MLSKWIIFTVIAVHLLPESLTYDYDTTEDTEAFEFARETLTKDAKDNIEAWSRKLEEHFQSRNQNIKDRFHGIPENFTNFILRLDQIFVETKKYPPTECTGTASEDMNIDIPQPFYIVLDNCGSNRATEVSNQKKNAEDRINDIVNDYGRRVFAHIEKCGRLPDDTKELKKYTCYLQLRISVLAFKGNLEVEFAKIIADTQRSISALYNDYEECLADVNTDLVYAFQQYIESLKDCLFYLPPSN